MHETCTKASVQKHHRRITSNNLSNINAANIYTTRHIVSCYTLHPLQGMFHLL
jgi:hypothetical protein